VPLFARESDLAFLSEYMSEQAKTLLLRFALKFPRPRRSFPTKNIA